MISIIEQLLRDALFQLKGGCILAYTGDVTIEIKRSQWKEKGYFYTNLALLLSRNTQRPAYDLAIAIVEALPIHPYVSRAVVTRGGVIYFHMTSLYRVHLLNHAIECSPLHRPIKTVTHVDQDKNSIQYAYGRTVALFEQLSTQSFRFDKSLGYLNCDKLIHPYEEELFFMMALVIEQTALTGTLGELRQVAYDLRRVANALHSYYNTVPILCECEALRSARLLLLTGVEHVLRYGIALLGLSALERD